MKVLESSLRDPAVTSQQLSQVLAQSPKTFVDDFSSTATQLGWLLLISYLRNTWLGECGSIVGRRTEDSRQPCSESRAGL